MTNLTSSSFSAPAYARLREQIRSDVVSGVWTLGQHVTLATLTAHYGVSANPVREALHQLQGEGVVEMRMNRGAVIRVADAQFVSNIYDVRGAIDALLASEAARLANEPYLAAVTRAVESHEAAVAQRPVLEIVEANRRLHRAINSIADNPLAHEIIEGRSTLVDALRRSLGYSTQRLTDVVRQHREFLAALHARDPDQAASVALHHARSARDDLLRLMEAQSAGKTA